MFVVSDESFVFIVESFDFAGQFLVCFTQPISATQPTASNFIQRGLELTEVIEQNRHSCCIASQGLIVVLSNPDKPEPNRL